MNMATDSSSLIQNIERVMILLNTSLLPQFRVDIEYIQSSQTMHNPAMLVALDERADVNSLIAYEHIAWKITLLETLKSAYSQHTTLRMHFAEMSQTWRELTEMYQTIKAKFDWRECVPHYDVIRQKFVNAMVHHTPDSEESESDAYHLWTAHHRRSALRIVFATLNEHNLLYQTDDERLLDSMLILHTPHWFLDHLGSWHNPEDLLRDDNPHTCWWKYREGYAEHGRSCIT